VGCWTTNYYSQQNAYAGIRLVDSNGMTHNTYGKYAVVGRAEVKMGGLWGTICNENFSDANAAMFCKHLGYSGGRHIDAGLIADGHPMKNIWIYDLQCGGPGGGGGGGMYDPPPSGIQYWYDREMNLSNWQTVYDSGYGDGTNQAHITAMAGNGDYLFVGC